MTNIEFLSQLPLLVQIGFVIVYAGAAYGLIAYGAGYKPAKVWAVTSGFILLVLACVACLVHTHG